MTNNWREVLVDWTGEMGFTGRNPAGGEVRFGTQGETPALSPMELLLAALGGCTGSDVVSILDKKRQDLTGLQVTVRGKRAEDYPKVYTEIIVEYTVWGNDLDESAVYRAIELSEEKYCSVSKMLGASVKITSEVLINPTREQIPDPH